MKSQPSKSVMSGGRRSLFILLFVAGLIAASLFVILNKPTKLGLDLQGGVSLIYQAKPTKQSQVTTESINRTIDIMRKRVDAFGVAEPEIQRSGNNQIDVALPDVSNAEQAAKQVGTTAQLYFYDWEKNVLGPDCKPQPDNNEVTGGAQAGTGPGAFDQYSALILASECPERNTGKETTGKQYYLIDSKKDKVLLGPAESRADLRDEAKAKKIKASKDQEIITIKPGTILVRAEQGDSKKPSQLYYVLRDAPALKGTDIRDPKQSFSSGGSGSPSVTFNFSKSGEEIWAKTTREIAQRGQNQFITGSPQEAFQHFAIVLDNEVISAPYIDFQQNPDGISGATGSEISGNFTIQSAQELATLLQTGALPIKLELISSSQISATLGKQALDQGIIAGAAGLLLVSLFLLLFYRVLGLVAIAALGVYAVFLFALVKLIPITMTLPGIAGLVLTIGVAADANIVIFERVKEEIRNGRSVPQAISRGYRKGLSAIIDANVVTFLVAFILFMLATAGVRGFAFTLGIGTIVSFLTAVVLTQAILSSISRSSLLTDSSVGAKSRKQRFRFNYMGKAKFFFAMSGVILVIGALAMGAKGLNLGIDFTSGTKVVAQLAKPASEAEIRKAITPLGLADAKIQGLSGAGQKANQGYQISAQTLSIDQRRQLESTLKQDYGGNYSFETIGPTFGQTIAKSAIIAIIASLLVISAYIALRFEWRYAVPVLIALLHDLLITAGVYALFGFEVNAATIAALLTILGYSLYDTIIVFDRVRENVPRMPQATFSQILNRSLSEVLMRSLATSFSTVLPILALLFFGGETLQSFAFALFVGVVSGAYSSLFIACPVLMHWKESEPKWRSRRSRILAEYGQVTPYADQEGEVEPVTSTRRSSPSIFAPEDPERRVSGDEFEQMVADLNEEVDQEEEQVILDRARDEGADLEPEDLVLKEKKPPKKVNRKRRKHGRAR